MRKKEPLIQRVALYGFFSYFSNNFNSLSTWAILFQVFDEEDLGTEEGVFDLGGFRYWCNTGVSKIPHKAHSLLQIGTEFWIRSFTLPQIRLPFFSYQKQKKRYLVRDKGIDAKLRPQQDPSLSMILTPNSDSNLSCTSSQMPLVLIFPKSMLYRGW